MREQMDFDQGSVSVSVGGTMPSLFVEAQYRKTEIRALYRDNDAAERVGKLMQSIERDVIPRLVSAGRKRSASLYSARKRRTIEATDVAQFAEILLGHTRNIDPSCFITSIRAKGVSVEDIYLHLLAPVARHVGALWDDDLCTFVDVTLALGALHRTMLALSAEFRFDLRRIDPARRILLIQLAGGQHTFGLQMVAEFFKRGAWAVDMASSQSNEILASLVKADWFTVIGFSVACEVDLGHLADAIQLLRASSLNKAVGVLVGGPAFLGHAEFVGRVGADGMAADAIHAVLEAERFVLQTA